jgi:hypothetical protein
MCQLDGGRVKHIKTFTGYKVAVQDKETNRLFSPATGLEYTLGIVKPVYHQKRITSYFRDDLLSKNPGVCTYSKNMIGRTTVFRNFNDARYLWHCINIYCGDWSDYRAVLLKMKISGALMKGMYNYDEPVIGGRRIISMEEIDVE